MYVLVVQGLRPHCNEEEILDNGSFHKAVFTFRWSSSQYSLCISHVICTLTVSLDEPTALRMEYGDQVRRLGVPYVDADLLIIICLCSFFTSKDTLPRHGVRYVTETVFYVPCSTRFALWRYRLLHYVEYGVRPNHY